MQGLPRKGEGPLDIVPASLAPTPNVTYMLPILLCPCSLTAGQAALLGGAALVLFLLLQQVLRNRSTSHIPAPPGFPIVGHIPYLVKEPWMRFKNFAAEYGAVYKLWVYNKLYVVVSDPELVKQIFADKKANFPKDNWSYAFFKWVGCGREGGGGEEADRRHSALLGTDTEGTGVCN